MSHNYTMGIVGHGWRAQLFADVVRRVPDAVTLVGAAVRRPESVEEVARRWSVPVFLSVEELMRKTRPDFVMTAVPWSVSPHIVTALVELGTRVLCETPPAPDAAGMRQLWDAVGSRRLVQVAEQYPLYPGHAARRELVRRGVIGEPTSVQVSSTHGYHAVSIVRALLGVGFEPVSVWASSITAPLVDPLTRTGWTDESAPRPAKTVIANLDFGGRSGLYDFTDNQWHNQLRARRIVVRGSHGEIVGDAVVRLAGPRTIVRSALVRSQLGYDLNLDGYDTEHISFGDEVVYRNPFLGCRLMDEEIAIATMLCTTGAWARDEGAPPYPLADGCQDHLISMAIDEAAQSGRKAVTDVEPWSGCK